MKLGNELRSIPSLNNEKSSENILVKKLTIAVALIFAIFFAAATATGFVSASVKNYTVTDGATQKSITTYEKLDEAQLLNQSGITVDGNDTVALTEKSTNNYMLNITRNCEITLTSYGKSENYIVKQGSVANALNEIGATVGENDVVSLSLTADVKEGLNICIDSVVFDTVTKTEELTYKEYTELAKSNDNLDDNAVKEGQTGVVVHVYKNKLVNGKIEESELIEQKLEKVTGTPTTTTTTTTTTTKAATKKQTATKASSNTSNAVAYASSGKSVSCTSVLTPDETILLDENGVPLNYSKKITGKATAYCTGSRTSTGVTPKPGYIAVDPREIPYGTKMYIRSSDGSYTYGYAIAADTGGFVHNSSTVADRYMYSYSDCINFGRRNIEIYILN